MSGTGLDSLRLELSTLESRLVDAALHDCAHLLPKPNAQLPMLSASYSNASSSMLAFVAPQPPPKLDRRTWKRVRSVEGLAAYRPRNPVADRSAFVATALTAGHDGRVLPRPTAVAVTGSTAGALNDMLYGLLAKDAPDLMLRGGYMPDDFVSGSVLLPLIRPTVDSPLRSAAVHRLIRDVGGKGNNLIEYVVLEATGMIDDSTGYHLRCSIPWAGIQSTRIDEQVIARGWMASVVLLRETHDGHSVHASGRTIVDATALSKSLSGDARAAANVALGGLVEAARCGQQKKLVWMIVGDTPANADTHRTAKLGGHVALAPRSDMYRCGGCDKKFNPLNSIATCVLCRMQMCSRCRISQSLQAIVRRMDGVEKERMEAETRPVALCKGCVIKARAVDALTAASGDVETQDVVEVKAESIGTPAKQVEEDETIGWFGWQHKDIRDDSNSEDATISSFSHPQVSRTRGQAEPRPQLVLFQTDNANETSELPSIIGYTNSYCSTVSVDRSTEWSVEASARPGASFSASLGPVSGSSTRSSYSSSLSAWSDDDIEEEIDTAACRPICEEHTRTSAQVQQEQLWRTMAALRVAAESTYQMTKQLGAGCSGDMQMHPQYYEKQGGTARRK